MKDIAPELLEKIQEAFQKGFDNSQIVKRYKALLAEGKATYVDANAYAVEVGNILAKAYKDNISADVLPDGRMYFNIAKRVIDPTMANNHDLVADYCEAVQTELNKAAGIGIKAIRPELNQDKIDGIVNRLSEEDAFEKISWILEEPILNFIQSVVDDAVKENAEFHHKAGLGPKIIRKEVGNCCDWCKKVVGSYEYPEVPEDVYRRHRYCRCTVEYDPGDGKRVNVHTKKESGSKEDTERRKQQYERWLEQTDAEKEIARRKRVEHAEELRANTVKNKRKSYNSLTLKTLEEKEWEPAFKAAAMSFYRKAHDTGVEFSVHGVSRVMDRARKAGLSENEIIRACLSNPSYIQNDGRFVYNAGKNIYLIQNPEAGDFVSCVERSALRKDWKELGDE